MNVAVVRRNLLSRRGIEDPKSEAEKLWKKFSETRQEPVRMGTALYGFFSAAGVKQEEMEAYGLYLKKHVRNAVETLIEEDDSEHILFMEEEGWFGKKELEGFIRTAIERQKSQSLISLMSLKDRKYGYEEEAFDI